MSRPIKARRGSSQTLILRKSADRRAWPQLQLAFHRLQCLRRDEAWADVEKLQGVLAELMRLDEGTLESLSSAATPLSTTRTSSRLTSTASSAPAPAARSQTWPKRIPACQVPRLHGGREGISSSPTTCRCTRIERGGPASYLACSAQRVSGCFDRLLKRPVHAPMLCEIVIRDARSALQVGIADACRKLPRLAIHRRRQLL